MRARLATADVAGDDRAGVDADAVNVASRIQSLNKELGTTVLVSGATCARLASTAGCTPLPDMQVKGHRAAVSVYALT